MDSGRKYTYCRQAWKLYSLSDRFKQLVLVGLPGTGLRLPQIVF